MELFTPGHLLVLAIIALVLFFGWKQLPDMARSVGRSLRIFKTEIKGMSEDDKARDEAKAPPAIEPASEQAAATPPPVVQPEPSPVTTPSNDNGKPAS